MGCKEVVNQQKCPVVISQMTILLGRENKELISAEV